MTKDVKMTSVWDYFDPDESFSEEVDEGRRNPLTSGIFQIPYGD